MWGFGCSFRVVENWEVGGGRWWYSGEVDEVESTVVRGVGILGES